MWENFWQRLSNFFTSDDGATAIEYGLITVGIATAIAAVTVTVGGDLSAFFAGLPALWGGG